MKRQLGRINAIRNHAADEEIQRETWLRQQRYYVSLDLRHRWAPYAILKFENERRLQFRNPWYTIPFDKSEIHGRIPNPPGYPGGGMVHPGIPPSSPSMPSPSQDPLLQHNSFSVSSSSQSANNPPSSSSIEATQAVVPHNTRGAGSGQLVVPSQGVGGVGGGGEFDPHYSVPFSPASSSQSSSQIVPHGLKEHIRNIDSQGPIQGGAAVTAAAPVADGDVLGDYMHIPKRPIVHLASGRQLPTKVPIDRNEFELAQRSSSRQKQRERIDSLTQPANYGPEHSKEGQYALTQEDLSYPSDVVGDGSLPPDNILGGSSSSSGSSSQAVVLHQRSQQQYPDSMPVNPTMATNLSHITPTRLNQGGHYMLPKILQPPPPPPPPAKPTIPSQDPFAVPVVSSTGKKRPREAIQQDTEAMIDKAMERIESVVQENKKPRVEFQPMEDVPPAFTSHSSEAPSVGGELQPYIPPPKPPLAEESGKFIGSTIKPGTRKKKRVLHSDDESESSSSTGPRKPGQPEAPPPIQDVLKDVMEAHSQDPEVVAEKQQAGFEQEYPLGAGEPTWKAMEDYIKSNATNVDEANALMEKLVQAYGENARQFLEVKTNEAIRAKRQEKYIEERNKMREGIARRAMERKMKQYLKENPDFGKLPSTPSDSELAATYAPFAAKPSASEEPMALESSAPAAGPDPSASEQVELSGGPSNTSGFGGGSVSEQPNDLPMDDEGAEYETNDLQVTPFQYPASSSSSSEPSSSSSSGSSSDSSSSIPPTQLPSTPSSSSTPSSMTPQPSKDFFIKPSPPSQYPAIPAIPTLDPRGEQMYRDQLNKAAAESAEKEKRAKELADFRALLERQKQANAEISVGGGGGGGGGYSSEEMHVDFSGPDDDQQSSNHANLFSESDSDFEEPPLPIRIPPLPPPQRRPLQIVSDQEAYNRAPQFVAPQPPPPSLNPMQYPNQAVTGASSLREHINTFRHNLPTGVAKNPSRLTMFSPFDRDFDNPSIMNPTGGKYAGKEAALNPGGDPFMITEPGKNGVDTLLEESTDPNALNYRNEGAKKINTMFKMAKEQVGPSKMAPTSSIAGVSPSSKAARDQTMNSGASTTGKGARTFSYGGPYNYPTIAGSAGNLSWRGGHVKRDGGGSSIWKRTKSKRGKAFGKKSKAKHRYLKYSNRKKKWKSLNKSQWKAYKGKRKSGSSTENSWPSFLRERGTLESILQAATKHG